MSVDRQLRAHALADALSHIEGCEVISNDSLAAITNSHRDYVIARLQQCILRVAQETLDSVSKGRVLEILETAVKDERQS